MSITLGRVALSRIDVLGRWLFVAGALLMIVGDVGFLAGIGIPLVIGSAAYAVGGMRLVRPLALPLAFLALMVPPPRFVLYEILFRLKLLVTRVAVELLQAAGIDPAGRAEEVPPPAYLALARAFAGI